ncbi:hypothetical protein [Paenibacillus sp. QZ-Y1]|uniref:hypothetical protein n=1 Tax=Paenibacillus sp. QZ-Y1 TaxID=3414511 RepID=UPI003F7ACE79
MIVLSSREDLIRFSKVTEEFKKFINQYLDDNFDDLEYEVNLIIGRKDGRHDHGVLSYTVAKDKENNIDPRSPDHFCTIECFGKHPIIHSGVL